MSEPSAASASSIPSAARTALTAEATAAEAALERLVALGASTPDIHVYIVDGTDGFDLRARMFAPFDGVGVLLVDGRGATLEHRFVRAVELLG